MPRSWVGWLILFFVILILMFGVSGAFAQAGIIAHEILHGLQTFGHNVRNG